MIREIGGQGRESPLGSIPLLDHLAARLLEPVLLERAYAAEELVESLTVFLRRVLDRRKLDGAEVVRCLLETVVGHRSLAPLDDAFGKHEADRLVERLLHDVLAVVVIDLHLVEALKEFQAIKQKARNIALHARGELCQILELAPAVDERSIGDGKALNQNVERVQHLLARLQVDPLVRPVAVQQRLRMERYVREVGAGEGLLVSGDLVGNALRLVVDHEGQKVVPGLPTPIAALVDEYAQVSRQYMPLDRIKAGG